MFNQSLSSFRISVLAVFMLCFSLASAQDYNIKVDKMKAHLMGKTAPLHTLVNKNGTSLQKIQHTKSSKVKDNFANITAPLRIKDRPLPEGDDPLVVRSKTRSVGELAEPTLVIEGIDQSTTNIFPPDPNGDVSKDHYIQIINASWFRIFDKEGNPLTDPTSTNTLWGEIGMSAIGDPIISYDENADRWLLTDLANLDRILYAVSVTPDPMGSWYIYTYSTPAWVDYPKYGVWPTAYIFTANEAGTGNGHPVYFINREQMLNGDATVDIQRVDIENLNGGFPTLTPMDWNSPNMPATDEIHVARINDDAWSGAATDVIEVWSINLDWEDETNTTFSSVSLPTAPFDSEACGGGGLPGTACVTQPEIGRTLDGIMTILMNNISYYNFGSHESAVYNTSVNAGMDTLTVRWGELRRYPGQNWELYQEGGVAGGDGLHRWMGSISMNGKGDIGLAYSVSGDSLYPSLRYTGRRDGDPLGEMTFDEYQFADGGSSFSTSNRYGDYSRMSIDPIDDSFWFTGEYLLDDGTYGSKIVNFEFTKDTFDIAPTALITPVSGGDLAADEIVTIEISNRGIETATDISVGYIFNNGAEIIEMAAIDSLFADSTYTHSFVSTADLSAIDDYPFKIFTSFGLDQNERNDTLTTIVRNIPRFDATVIATRGLEDIICMDNVEAGIEIRNLGTDTLKNVNLNYSLNGGPITTIQSTPDIAINEDATIPLSLSDLIDGTNELMVYTSDPNNVADQIPANDTLTQEFMVLLGGQEVSLLLLTDNFPQETSWQLFDEDGNELYSGDSYTSGQNLYTIPMCLEEEKCYSFFIYDTYGDGIQFGGVSGDYQIIDAMGNELASIINVNFGSVEQNTFCLNVPCNLAADVTVEDAATSNSQDGVILIDVTSGVAPFEYSIDGGLSFTGGSIFPDLDDGDYTVVVRDANNCVIEFEVTVDATVANANIFQSEAINISPNPSANGAFLVEIDGIVNHTDGGIPLKIRDASGKLIGHDLLTRINNQYISMVSLKNQPAGIYYFQLVHPDLGEKAVKKVIRL